MGFLDEPYQPNAVEKPTTPVANQMPYANLTPKMQQEQMSKDAEDYRKRQEVLNTAIQNYNNLLPEYKRFSDLNKEVATGGYVPFGYGGSVGLKNALGLVGTMSPEEQQMLMIQNKLTPLQRPAGAGATSNFEEQMYLRSVPNLGMKGNANREAAQDAYRQYYNVLGYNKYMDDYFKSHGNLQGVDSKWGQYKDAYINQAKKDNPQYANMILPSSQSTTLPANKTKAQKQGDILQKDSNKSLLNTADDIIAKSSKGDNQ